MVFMVPKRSRLISGIAFPDVKTAAVVLVSSGSLVDNDGNRVSFSAAMCNVVS